MRSPATDDRAGARERDDRGLAVGLLVVERQRRRRTSTTRNATLRHPADSGVTSSRTPAPADGRIGPERFVDATVSPPAATRRRSTMPDSHERTQASWKLT